MSGPATLFSYLLGPILRFHSVIEGTLLYFQYCYSPSTTLLTALSENHPPPMNMRASPIERKPLRAAPIEGLAWCQPIT